MEPAPLLTELLRHGVHEGGDVVVRPRLDLGDAIRRGCDGSLADSRGRVGVHDAELGPRVQRGELDLEPACEPALVRPDRGHGRARIAGDHRCQSRDRSGWPGRCSAALREDPRREDGGVPRAVHRDARHRLPGGIWTIASRASRPSSTLLLDRSGTPMTGSSLYAATVPGSAAAIPAPAIRTRTPRNAAVDAYSATARGRGAPTSR